MVMLGVRQIKRTCVLGQRWICLMEMMMMRQLLLLLLVLLQLQLVLMQVHQTLGSKIT